MKNCIILCSKVQHYMSYTRCLASDLLLEQLKKEQEEGKQQEK